MSAEPKLTNQDYELLSAYIDGELTDAERSALESRLQTEAALRWELESLRQTVALVNQLPTLKAPRDFLLTSDMVRQPRVLPRRQPLYMRPSIWSAAAAVVVLIFGALFILSSSEMKQSASFDKAVESVSGSSAVADQVAALPTLIPTVESQQANLPASAVMSSPTATMADQDVFYGETTSPAQTLGDVGGESAPVTGYVAPAPTTNEMLSGAVAIEEEGRTETFAEDAALDQSVVPSDTEKAAPTVVLQQPMMNTAPSSGGGAPGASDLTQAAEIPLPAAAPSDARDVFPQEQAELTTEPPAALAAVPTVSPSPTVIAARMDESGLLERQATETPETGQARQKNESSSAVVAIMAAAALVLVISTWFMLRGRHPRS